MADKRRGDDKPFPPFRTKRFFQEAGRWYFHTREATLEGPFETREHAQTRLEEYVKIIASGWLPLDSQLSMEPMEP